MLTVPGATACSFDIVGDGGSCDIPASTATTFDVVGAPNNPEISRPPSYIFATYHADLLGSIEDSDAEDEWIVVDRDGGKVRPEEAAAETHNIH